MIEAMFVCINYKSILGAPEKMFRKYTFCQDWLWNCLSRSSNDHTFSIFYLEQVSANTIFFCLSAVATYLHYLLYILTYLHLQFYISTIYNPQYALFSPVCMGVLGTIKMSTYGLMNDHKHGNVQLLWRKYCCSVHYALYTKATQLNESFRSFWKTLPPSKFCWFKQRKTIHNTYLSSV